MPYQPEKIGHVDVYYHALILYSAHWAAYVAMMCMLLGTGVALSLTGIAAPGWRVFGVAAVTLIAFLGTLYFTLGIKLYGEMLCDAVPRE